MIGKEIDNKLPLVFEIPNILTSNQCKEWIYRIRKANPKPAPINTPTGTRIVTQIRNNNRVIFDNQKWADELFEPIINEVPKEFLGMHLCGINERLRCYEYLPGHRFAPHSDGAFYRTDTEQSFYTYLIYLNDDFEGGETVFLVEPEIKIIPESGTGLFFQHPIFHEGAEVKSGKKYVVRTDLMYRESAK